MIFWLNVYILQNISADFGTFNSADNIVYKEKQVSWLR